MYTELIGAATVRGFKSAVISLVVSNRRREKRNTFRDYLMICFLALYLVECVPSWIFDACFSCVTLSGDTPKVIILLKMRGSKKVPIAWEEERLCSSDSSAYCGIYLFWLPRTWLGSISSTETGYKFVFNCGRASPAGRP